MDIIVKENNMIINLHFNDGVDIHINSKNG